MGLRIAGYALLAAAILLAGAVLYRNSPGSEIPLVYAPTQLLNATWTRFLQNYAEPGSGRIIDKSRENITTSEGESYAMLRAVWIGDKTSFDSSWNFTKDNLQHRSGDALFSWLFGKRPDGSYGVLSDAGGNTTASDADSDIALSLVFAYARWQDPQYLSEAKRIIGDIWDKEVITVRGVPYLTANNLEKFSTSSTVLIDPSYFAPYAYRIFAQVDPAHPWEKLADGSYDLLKRSMTEPLDSGSAAGLPPDWVAMNKESGALSAPDRPDLTTQYGYDAMRVPWRLALDWQWYQDPRDQRLLSLMAPLKNSWRADGKLPTVWAHNGAVVGAYESPAMYGSAIGYFMVADPSDAPKVYADKLVYLYDPDLNGWKETLSYYDDNWAWFGIGLYNHLLPNLTATLPQGAL